MVSHPQLVAVIDALTTITGRVHGFHRLAPQDFTRRPSAQSWSAAECVRHLSLTTKSYLPMIDEALAGPAAGTVPPGHRYRADLIGRLLAWLQEPPFRTRTRTTQAFTPIAVGSPLDVIAEFETLQSALIARVEACEGHDLERARLVSPFNARVKYNLYAAMLILAAHERRHLWQADRALASGLSASR